MRKNQLGTSDIYISELTLGLMSLGTNKKRAQHIIDTALDAGVNHLDTADLYDFGLNEEIVGEAIKEKRNDLILTTKVGNHFNKEKQDWFWDPSKEHIMEGVKESLSRLQTDYIDFYMLHGGTIDDPIDETIEAFEQLKQEGLIRAYGISSIRPNVIREYVRRSSIDGVMMQYSMLDRRPEEEILDLLLRNNISVLARGPLAKGMLSNNKDKQIENKGKDGYLDYNCGELTHLMETLAGKLDETSSFNELALNYVLKHPTVASAVFGASSVQQVEENVKINHTLSDDMYRYIQEITKALHYTQHR